MCRMNVVRTLGLLAMAVAITAMTAPSAVAGLFSRSSRYQRTDYVSVNHVKHEASHHSHHPHHGHHDVCHHDGPCHPAVCHKAIYWNPSLLRYVRVIYFSEQFSAWFEVDSLVHPYGAVLGNSALVLVPKIGYVRGWIVAVHGMPPMNSPYRSQSEVAPRVQAGNTQQMNLRSLQSPDSLVTMASAAANQAVASPERSAATGYVRVWTNKAGTRTAKAELLQVRNDSILVRDSSGNVFEQSFDSLSDADVAFVKSGAIPVAQLAVKQ